jgi:hypothetical protein
VSKYSDKVAARNAAENALAVAIEITERPHGVPTATRRPRTPPPGQRGVLVDLGPMPENCARLYEIAADALDRASAVAREMLAHTHRSAQSGEATSAALLAETTAPRLRAAAVRLRRMPARPKGGAA